MGHNIVALLSVMDVYAYEGNSNNINLYEYMATLPCSFQTNLLSSMKLSLIFK